MTNDIGCCPKCGKAMTPCGYEGTYYQILKCFRCGYKVGTSKHIRETMERIK